MNALQGRSLLHMSLCFSLLAALTACGGGRNSTAPTYTLGGTISGLTVSGLVLANGSATLNIDAGATTFTIAASLMPGSPYDVTIKTLPVGFSCLLANGAGTANSNVQNVAITCTPLTYSLGGSIQGLNSKGLVLAN